MNSMVWISVVSTIILKVRSDLYEHHYAESDCSKYRSSTANYTLAPYGHASSAIIKATHLLSYSYPFDCNITVAVRNSRDAHVLLKVQKISFPYKSNCKNYIRIYKENEGSYQLCSKNDVKVKSHFTQPSKNKITFLYHTETSNGGKHHSDDFFNSGFHILATAYTYSPCGKHLSFLCDNGICISKKLVRDGYDNCGDGSDEFRLIRFRLPTSAITGIIIGILLLIAAVSCAVWIIRRKRLVTTRTYTTPAQPLYPTGPQPYPQAPVQYNPFPSAPGTPNQYGGEVYQKPGEPSSQYRGVTNPAYGQPPPPPYQ